MSEGLCGYNRVQSDIISKINKGYREFSKGQKLIADYILDNYEKAVFFTAAKLGEVVGVSESTVSRFAVLLGYEGFPQFHRALEEVVKNKLNTVQRMEVTNDRIKQGDLLKTVLQSDADNIRKTIDGIDQEAFDKAVEIILNARTIYIIGVRSSAPLASFLAFYLSVVFQQVKLVESYSMGELFEKIIHIDEKDVMIGISFPRYSLSTIRAVEFAEKRKADIITITDSYESPLTTYSKCNLIADNGLASVVDSLVAPMSVINALIVAVFLKKQDTVTETLAAMEDIWRQYQIYGSSDDFERMTKYEM
ncbi:MurR/RpiR family transcriptional regulator [Anaeromicropila populeti]|uniref:Transcriptional regulator, RpiR family n=1 Tax=Anaeromicropila populeti TaxID=37658 RepID=A0A1I6KGU8_9FIRM|nr:MurR/RpiR family transcriptional regulator [Anaeromicropila populeti]SFR90268.1 transcriptional regulator, RpiR family [Anaeromicropila populeti]